MSQNSAEKTIQKFFLFVCFNKIKGLTWKLWQSFAEYIKKKNQSP